ncbi:MAG: zf-HC2 domain-containing protein, partial [Thermanaerothrix sp.]|nr:zf-HC2 domain-containing protein [Thermanaerothrix sp.]
MKTRLTLKEWERLSAYLDGELSERERRQVEEWLRTRPEVREAWQSLRQTHYVLRHAPRRKAPRNFALTPAMVGVPSPQPRSALVWQLVPALAVFLVLVAVVLEFLPMGGDTTLSRAPLTAAAPMEAMQASQPTATAVIVYWGGPPPAIG